MMQQLPTPPAPPAPPALPAQAPLSQAQSIGLLRAEIAGIKQEISELTSQLTNGTSDAREEVVTDQIEAATERMQTLQGVLDRYISGEPAIAVTVAPEMPPPMEPIDVTAISAWLFSSIAVTVLLLPIIRSWTRRTELRVKSAHTPDDGRLDRIEQAIDALAVEMERVSEGQRYSARLLNEMRALPAPSAEPFVIRERERAAERRTANTPV